MTEEKICPFMSRVVYAGEYGQMPTYQNGIVTCQRERCMAWEKHSPVDEYDTFEGGWCRLIP